jgi:GT2 family glycosyltransferase
VKPDNRGERVRGASPRCAVIIPTYNGAALTGACVEALLANPPSSSLADVIVVDDGSTDGTPQALARFGSRIQLLEQEVNAGFAAACNAGARLAPHHDFLVFLNNDTLPTAGWLDALVAEALADDRVAAVGAKLLFPNGQVQHAGVVIGQDRWPHHLYAGFPDDHPAVCRSREVTAVTAACMLVRRTDFEQLGGFDEDFHNGYEDVDFCLRLAQRSRTIRYCAESVVYHLESVTRWPSGAPERTAANDQLFSDRWRDRAAIDDLQHYLADGLLGFSYGPYYPLTITVSPDLAVVRTSQGELAGLERLVSVRSRQVMELVGAQIRSKLQPGAYVPDDFPAARRPAHGCEQVASGREHRLGSGAAQHFVSVLIPVKDGEHHLVELLPSILQQSISTRLEIVAIDSGSRDGSVDVLTRFGATVLSIDPTEFDHGLTRNLAAEHAQGDVLVFLSQRARPVGDKWLAPLIAALDADPAIAGVCSRVIPAPDADLLTRRDMERDPSGSSDPRRAQIEDWSAYRSMSPDERRLFLNFHTVSAAIRPDALRQIPFRSVRTLGEDLLWAREIVEAGWALLHEPASIVHHLHAYSLDELFSRNVDDGIANLDILERTLDREQILPMIRAMAEDDRLYLHEAGLDREELDHWRLESMLRRTAQVVGQWIGLNYRSLPAGMADHFSSFSQIRSGGGESPAATDGQ